MYFGGVFNVRNMPCINRPVLFTWRETVRGYFRPTIASLSRPDIKKHLFMEQLPDYYTLPQCIIDIESGKHPSPPLQDKLM